MKHIDLVKCVTSGKGFVKGEIYPVVGWNNGVQIARTGKEGEEKHYTFMCGGIGNGYINSLDNCGKPSFDLFIHLRSEEPDEEETGAPKEECKTKRVQLVFTPSFTQTVKEMAWNEKKSMNQFIIDCIQEHINRGGK